jgi:hypothetical protein
MRFRWSCNTQFIRLSEDDRIHYFILAVRLLLHVLSQWLRASCGVQSTVTIWRSMIRKAKMSFVGKKTKSWSWHSLNSLTTCSSCLHAIGSVWAAVSSDDSSSTPSRFGSYKCSRDVPKHGISTFGSAASLIFFDVSADR